MPTYRKNTDNGFSSLSATHERICASFLGPKGENQRVLQDIFAAITQDMQEAREKFYPDDPTFIDQATIQSAAYSKQVMKLEGYVDFLSKMLAKHCIPFFSPRYNGHMVSDASMPAILGYLVGMLWNQNNVTPEASPITSHVEYLVGQQLCRLLGYRSYYDPKPAIHPAPAIGWGHITCGGSVANLESAWVARNLKFYPLSLLRAIKEGSLFFVADAFEVNLCNGDKKKLAICSAWELLNLTVDEILDLPTRLVNDYGISTQFIEAAVAPYLIANTGKETLETDFKVKTPKMAVSLACHYSWPKSTSITGVGMDNLVHIGVDIAARMDMERLDKFLRECLEEQQAVYMVVSIMGTTEHGAVDPLFDIIQLRDHYQKMGLSFYVHVDAAWLKGGYFASMLPPPESVIIPLPADLPPSGDIVLQRPLSEYTKNQLFSIRFADSCTVDPHKAGFAPYPSGSLCYRDERLRFMVTMTAAYINTTADVDNVGTYGVEGSKPGAAATSVWLAHNVIGLHHKGYGALLGEAMYTSAKLYCNWATMTFNEPDLIVKTLVMLPSERDGLPQSVIDEETQYIIDNIVNKPNSEILQDRDAMEKLSELGGDLVITVFACNFRLDGKINEDVAEANFLNRRLFERFSVTKRQDDPYTRELIVGSTNLEEKTYGLALEKYKERLGLKGEGDLTVMTLVPMSPFPTAHSLIKDLANTFKEAAKEEMKECQDRIATTPAHHSFVMQGTDKLFLSYISVFHIGNYRQQVVVTAELPADVMHAYVREVQDEPAALFTLTTEKVLLSEVLFDGHCKVSIHKGLNTKYPKLFFSDIQLTNITVIVNRSIAPKHLDKVYPEYMPFYLYGTEQQQHVDHMLLRAPNAQLTASGVVLILDKPIPSLVDEDSGLLEGLIAVANTTREHAMQPFNADHKPSFFVPGPEREIPVIIYRDPNPANANGPGLLKGLGEPVATGAMTLGPCIFVDYTLVNQEHGIALSEKHHKAKAPGVPDMSHRIGGMPVHGERYSITPMDMAAIFNGLVAHHPGDKHTRKAIIRKGWRDAFHEELAKRKLEKV
ncbi:hypothetical protein NLJ89_g7216 [Agrocybe chaxingu]|uniref:PLP-dependent transferase n=1 Tax=Agrocybe chaxingu TaxID=84603 RepID=A0A9W8JUY7_9AGAR|nr:hypothetical protein NLJ89_g7216 [Agrocybe chaxingu]